jgi:hypothetical protein
MGFRMTDSPFPRTSPNPFDADIDGFPFPSASTTRAAHVNSRFAAKMEAETVAFGYHARALVFVQRVRNRTFGYPRHAPSLTASDGLALLNRVWDFRSDFARIAETFLETGNRGGASIKEYSPRDMRRTRSVLYSLARP